MTVEQQMREEWNERARQDAYYYAGFGRREQAASEFLSSAEDIIPVFTAPLHRLSTTDRDSLRALEIGCGPGRLLRSLQGYFGEIHGVDVSDEMVHIAKQNVSGIAHAHVHHSSGADLKMFASNSFHYVYSYAVFQHIPERDVVLSYLAESRRVLQPGGIIHCQFRGIKQNVFQAEQQSRTWNGCVFLADEMYILARKLGLQLLMISGANSQYLWTTLRKMPDHPLDFASEVKLNGVCATHCALPIVPVSGLGAAITIWVQGLADFCDLTNLEVSFDGQLGPPCYLGPREGQGCYQLNAIVPENMRTGLIPVRLYHEGKPITESRWIRIVPPIPWTPQVLSVRDGRSLCLLNRIESGFICLRVLELPSPDRLRMVIAGQEAIKLDHVCMDPISKQQDFTFQIPSGLSDGNHLLLVLLSGREIYRAVVTLEGGASDVNQQTVRDEERTA